MTDLTTLQGWLIEAETAKHKLLTGGLYASVSYNGRNEVTFAKTEIDKLDAYIASLRNQIGVLNGDARSRTRPIYLGF